MYIASLKTVLYFQIQKMYKWCVLLFILALVIQTYIIYRTIKSKS